MRIVLIAVVAAAAVFSGLPAGQAREGPWCAVMATGVDEIEVECSFRSLEACLPYVLSGNRGSCERNLRWHGDNPAARKRARKGRKQRMRRR